MTHPDYTLAVLLESERRHGRIVVAEELAHGLRRLRQHDSFCDAGSYARECIVRYLNDGTTLAIADLPRIYAALEQLDNYSQKVAA